MEVADIENVGTHHSAVKQGGKVKEKGNTVPVLKGLPAYYIGGHGYKKKAAKGPDGGDEYGYPIGFYHLHWKFKDHFV